MAESYSFLKDVNFFDVLGDNELAEIAALLVTRHYRKGQVIFMEDEPGEALYILRKGLVKLSKLSEEGREQVLHYVHPGSIFAEVVIFDGGPYPATAEAVDDSEVGVLYNKDMEQLLLQEPELALKMLRLMSRRLRAAQRTIRDLALKDAYSRMSGLLLRLQKRQGLQGEGERLVLKTEMTRQEMASIIGVTRETVARILSRWQKESIIEVHRDKIIILNQEKLLDWI
ncbi:MAG: Crp/Fnr family transcriptional regulator [Firmicutes bacterium]|nr:Crp/Fnr family transcriptional regulator [Bacillota bacterium]